MSFIASIRFVECDDSDLSEPIKSLCFRHARLAFATALRTTAPTACSSGPIKTRCAHVRARECEVILCVALARTMNKQPVGHSSDQLASDRTTNEAMILSVHNLLFGFTSLTAVSQAINNRFMHAPLTSPSSKHWTEVRANARECVCFTPSRWDITSAHVCGVIM